MSDVSDMKTGIVLDGKVYEICEHRYGCFATADAGEPGAYNEYFAHADAEVVGTILLKRYRRNERIIKETVV